MKSLGLAAAAAMVPIKLMAADAKRPNIVVIYADDLGYGDVSCYGATKIKTPNIDTLASQGLRFTNAHSPSATCTPSRYAMLTGEYAWRKKGTGILPGDARMIIQPGRTTLPAVMQKAGYTTGVVGKWHLGLGGRNLDWNGDIAPGPLDIGFDYCFLIPATGDRVPCVYVESRRVVGLDPKDPIQVSFSKPIGNEPTGKDHPELLKMHPSHGHNQTIINGISRIGYMSGGKAARWVDEDMADTITGKAKYFIEKHKDRPFFLYFSTHDIHVPRVPHPRFAGKSGLGARGDAILQFDWCAGEILKTLDRLNLTENTLVIFTSDNGPVVDDGYKDEAVEKLHGHKPAGPLRGGKYSAFDAGTRVPFIVRWPRRVKTGLSDALVCQIDFMASLAALTGQKLALDDAPDSFDVLAALLGEMPAGRDHLVEHAGVLSLIRGQWKYIEPGRGPKVNANTGIELGHDTQPQLYDLKNDLAEKHNVAAEHPELIKELTALLKKIRDDGRTRP
jgi:arylsulfatase A-like enzyme